MIKLLSPIGIDFLIYETKYYFIFVIIIATVSIIVEIFLLIHYWAYEEIHTIKDYMVVLSAIFFIVVSVLFDIAQIFAIYYSV